MFPALAASAPLVGGRRSGLRDFTALWGNPDMGLDLYGTFLEAGLPAPVVHMEVPLGNDPGFIRWIYDVLCSLLPQIQRLNLPLETLGDLNTLSERLQVEVAVSRGVVTWMALVSAWARNRNDEAPL